MAQTQPRLNPDDRFALVLDGVVCGKLIAAEGGDISAPVVREPDASGLVRKRLGPSEPEPIELTLDLSLQPAVYEWIDAFWQGKSSEKSGILVPVDPALRAKGVVAFEDAFIETTSFPRGDAATRVPGSLAVTIRPQQTTLVPDSGQPLPRLGSTPKQRAWLTSNFVLQIGGLDCGRVTAVDADPIARSPDGIDVPDLRITLAEAGADQWDAWHVEFVEQGENDPANEKSGTLTFLGPDLKTPLGSVTLSGLGIYRLRAAPSVEDHREQIRRLDAELYCQQMSLSVPS